MYVRVHSYADDVEYYSSRTVTMESLAMSCYGTHLIVVYAFTLYIHAVLFAFLKFCIQLPIVVVDFFSLYSLNTIVFFVYATVFIC